MWRKGGGFLQQAFKEKVSGGEVDKTEESDEFVEGKKKMKQMRLAISEAIRAGNQYIKQSRIGIDAGLTFYDKLNEYGSELGQENAMGSGLVKITQSLKELEEERKILLQEWEADFLEPLQAFLDGDVQALRDLKTQYYKTRLQFDGLRNQATKEEEKEKMQPKKVLSSNRLFEDIKFAWDDLKATVERHLFEMTRKIDHFILERTLAAMAAQNKYFHKGTEILDSLTSYEEAMVEFVRKSETELEQQLEEKDSKSAHEKQLQNENIDRPLATLLSDPATPIIDALCELHKDWEVQRVILDDILKILDVHGMSLPLIYTGIENEVKGASSPHTLFRVNTATTKLMTAFTKQVGADYLLSTVMPLSFQVALHPERLELDPMRLNPTDDVEDHKAHLQNTSQQFLDTITQSLEQCPLQLRMICNHLMQLVEKKFPENRLTGVAGFMFLRFFCPAIMNPEREGTMGSGWVNQNARRALILVTKVLQNTANGVEFGAKEPYMKPINVFVQKNKESLQQWFEKLSMLPEGVEISSLGSIYSKELVQKEAIPRLCDQIVKDIDGLADKLPKELFVNLVKVITERERLWKYICPTPGPPPKAPKPSHTSWAVLGGGGSRPLTSMPPKHRPVTAADFKRFETGGFNRQATTTSQLGGSARSILLKRDIIQPATTDALPEPELEIEDEKEQLDEDIGDVSSLSRAVTSTAAELHRRRNTQIEEEMKGEKEGKEEEEEEEQQSNPPPPPAWRRQQQDTLEKKKTPPPPPPRRRLPKAPGSSPTNT